jgi:hypothetical protein
MVSDEVVAGHRCCRCRGPAGRSPVGRRILTLMTEGLTV